MSMSKIGLFKRTVASIIVGALLIAAPGLPCYKALAQEVGGSAADAGMGVIPTNFTDAGAVSAATNRQNLRFDAVHPVKLDNLDRNILAPSAWIRGAAVDAAVLNGRSFSKSVAAASGSRTADASVKFSNRDVAGMLNSGASRVVSALLGAEAYRSLSGVAAANLSNSGKVPLAPKRISHSASVALEKAAVEQSMSGVLGERSLRADSADINARQTGNGVVGAAPVVTGNPASGISDLADGLGRLAYSGAKSSKPESLPGDVPSGAVRSSRDSNSTPPGGGSNAAGFSRFNFGGILLFVAALAAGAGGLIVLNHFAILKLPFIFAGAAAVPAAIVWSAISAALVIPIYAVERFKVLGSRHSPRLIGDKLYVDLLMGAILGLGWLALPHLGAAFAVFKTFSLAMKIAPALFIGSFYFGETRTAPGKVLGGFSTWAVALAMPAAATLRLTLAGILGIIAMPAMMTLFFSIGSIINAARNGRQFQANPALRFPSYQFVMAGVILAKLLGLSAPALWVNIIFGLWSTPNISKYFKWAYVALFGVAVYLGVTAGLSATVIPAFFLVAFSGERGQIASEWVLSKLNPERRSEAAVTEESLQAGTSAKIAPSKWSSRFENLVGLPGVADAGGSAKVPNQHNTLRTIVYLAMLGGLGILTATWLGGWLAFGKALLPAAIMALVGVFGSRYIIKYLYKAKPIQDAPQDAYGVREFRAVRTLLTAINKERISRGKKPLDKLPELVRIDEEHFPAPNAFATGFNPTHAMIGITEDFEEMALNGKTLRTGLIRVMDFVRASMTTAETPQQRQDAQLIFEAFRKALRGVIATIPENATPEDIKRILNSAREAELSKSLEEAGDNALIAVLGHEFGGHIMNYDIAINGAATTLNSAVSQLSRAFIWAIGTAQKAYQSAKARVKRFVSVTLLGKPEDSVKTKNLALPAGAGGAGVLLFADWVSVLAAVLQLSISRRRESAADEAGAKLSGKPEWLALALALLVTYQPASGYQVKETQLPMMAALSRVTTVDPIEQLARNGALERPDSNQVAVPSSNGNNGSVDPNIPPATAKDNWLQELFMTHPDTVGRMVWLARSALSQFWNRFFGDGGDGAGTSAPGNASPLAGPKKDIPAASDNTDTPLKPQANAPGTPISFNVGTDGALNQPQLTPAHPLIAMKRQVLVPYDPDPPPLTYPPQLAGSPGTWESNAVGDFFRKAWNSIFYMLPDKSRNRTIWALLWGDVFTPFISSFSQTAIYFLAGTSTQRSYAMAAIYGSQAASNLTNGRLIDRSPSVPLLLVKTYSILALLPLLLAVPFFGFHIWSFFVIFLPFLFARGYLQGLTGNGEETLFNGALKGYSASNNKLYSVFSLVGGVVGFFSSLIAGSAIVAWGAKALSSPLLAGNPHRALAGGVLAYVAVAAPLYLAVAVIYWYLLIPGKGIAQKARTTVEEGEKAWRSLYERWKLFLRLKPSFLCAQIAQFKLKWKLTQLYIRARITRWRSTGKIRVAASDMAWRAPSVSVLSRVVDGKYERFLVVRISPELQEICKRAGGEVPREFDGMAVEIVAPAAAEFGMGLRLTVGDSYLNLMTWSSTVELFFGGGFLIVVGQYLTNIFGAAAPVLPGALAGFPLLGAFLKALMTQNGAIGLYLAAGALGSNFLLPFVMKLWRDKPREALEALSVQFRDVVKERAPSLGDKADEAVVRTMEDAVYGDRGALAEYRAQWKENQSVLWNSKELQEKSWAGIKDGLHQSFAGQLTEQEIDGLADDADLKVQVDEWAANHYAVLLKEARREAKSGLTLQQRRLRYAMVIFAGGALMNWAVISTHSLGISLIMVALSCILQTAAPIVWGSLTTDVYNRRYGSQKGRLLAFASIYQLIWTIAGGLVFGLLAQYFWPGALAAFHVSIGLICAMTLYAAWRAPRAAAKSLALASSETNQNVRPAKMAPNPAGFHRH